MAQGGFYVEVVGGPFGFGGGGWLGERISRSNRIVASTLVSISDVGG